MVRGAWQARVHEVGRVRHGLVTKPLPKRPGLMDLSDGGPGAQHLWYEGKSPVEMAELTSLMFFLIPSLTMGWGLWVLEGLHLLALMGFSREQLCVSTHLLILMPLSLKVI